MRITYSDNPVASTRDMELQGTRQVISVDSAGNPVSVEIHRYSQLKRSHEDSVRRTFKPSAGAQDTLGRSEWVAEDATSELVVS